jgi:hypothetical protein
VSDTPLEVLELLIKREFHDCSPTCGPQRRIWRSSRLAQR